MNKKFSTLLTAGLLVGGSLFVPVNATDVTPTQFTAAIKSNVLSIEDLKEALTDFDGKIELTGDVDLSTGNPTVKYVVITDEDIVLTAAKDKEVTFTGRVVIGAEGVTISGLKFVNNPETGIGGYWQKTAIAAFASKVTITGNTFTAGNNPVTLTNGVVLYPQNEKVEWTVSGNTFEGLNKVVDKWYSSAIQVYQGTAGEVKAGDPLKDSGLLGVNVESGPADNATPIIKEGLNAATLASGNTFENCAADVFVRNNVELAAGASTEAAYVSNPEASANEAVKAALKDAISTVAENGSINFAGTAAELNDLLKAETDLANVAITTEDQIVVTGIKYMPQEQIKVTSDDVLFNLAAKTVDGAYYLLVKAGENASSSAQADSVLILNNGAPEFVAVAGVTATQLADPANYWKVETKTAIKTVDYTFTNKADEPYTLKVNGETVLRALGNVAYDKGVAFELAQDPTTKAPIVGAAHYFGLYTADVYQLSASDLNWFEKDGFSVTIAPEGVKGNPFAGHLTPMKWNSTKKAFEVATTTDNELYFMTEAEKYIVVKEYEANGSIYNQSIYAFDTVSEEDLVADLKKAKVEDRKLFGEFNAFYFPKTALVEDELTTASIDSMTVKVLGLNATTKKKELQSAVVGFAYLTEKKVATLAASIEFGLNKIAISMGDNVVKPENLLKDAYFTVTMLTEDGDDLRLAVNDCEGKGWVESVGNELEAQWAITYDEKTAKYTLTNRENKDVTIEVDRNALREDEDTEDNYYVYNGDVVEIKAVEGAKASDGYLYLGDIDNQRFVMAHHSGVYKQNAWFVENKDGFVVLDVDATPMEIKVIDVDTAKVTTTVGFYKDGKYTTKDYTLKAPVYLFANMKGSELGLVEGKYAFDANQDTLAIRQDGEYYNLRVVKNGAAMECAKVYASTSDKDAGFLKKQNGLYTETTNDLFVVESLDRPVYRRLGVTIENDGFVNEGVNNAKFYRTNDVTGYYLYENSANRNTQGGARSLNFLGETHLTDLPANAALPIFIDTAYVRNETHKPLYMLAVRNEDAVEGTPFKPCDKEDNHGYDQDGNPLTAEQCPHATQAVPGYRKAHYLVALSDSIYTGNNDMVEYKGKTRLAFVPATHFENDTLVIESSKFTNSKKLAKNDTLSLANDKDEALMNAATFAFRLVDPADKENGDFYIETEVNGKTNYVHVLNTVPVLVENIADAAPFNVELTDEDATANDAIAVDGVKVIATEGAVIIKGAAGKKVAISNVLGQTIANTVLSSDNATISAPAGIVVVAVEGEAAVKAIVK
ncbi:DUF6383 domain-containing protein [Parabacteroides gordonii]|uniref:DUF6383 domain-containing protein n=3 Tax=Parabacteroides gordonii TaxID=574930 RepID=A0A0F5JMC2_9BACT|nr:DUF6383 domain-containing protein [Parabacteroides gordonii]KKB58567.1 hypothetical protein HMPREF1536_01444 [Parabacteroides gordonii MS-1 = DSM 23371]MCA5583172.1 DUF6383 domain-containing protein [Parabacteroides gordonii]